MKGNTNDTKRHERDGARLGSGGGRRRMSGCQAVSRRFALCAALGACLVPIAALAQPPDLSVGQEWSVKSTPPTSVKVIIGRIDPGPNGATIVSVSIVDIPPGEGPRSVGHAPFDALSTLNSRGDIYCAKMVLQVASLFSRGQHH